VPFLLPVAWYQVPGQAELLLLLPLQPVPVPGLQVLPGPRAQQVLPWFLRSQLPGPVLLARAPGLLLQQPVRALVPVWSTASVHCWWRLQRVPAQQACCAVLRPVQAGAW
jgi:hypothetical protein